MPILNVDDESPIPRRPGRPALDESERRSVRVVHYLTAAEAAKLEALGGVAWLRRQLTKAKP